MRAKYLQSVNLGDFLAIEPASIYFSVTHSSCWLRPVQWKYELVVISSGPTPVLPLLDAVFNIQFLGQPRPTCVIAGGKQLQNTHCPPAPFDCLWLDVVTMKVSPRWNGAEIILQLQWEQCPRQYRWQRIVVCGQQEPLVNEDRVLSTSKIAHTPFWVFARYVQTALLTQAKKNVFSWWKVYLGFVAK